MADSPVQWGGDVVVGSQPDSTNPEMRIQRAHRVCRGKRHPPSIFPPLRHSSTAGSRLGAHWRWSGAGWGDGDFNGDGRVDDRDAAILAAHWGQVFVSESTGSEQQTSDGEPGAPAAGRFVGPSWARLDGDPPRRIEPLPRRLSSAAQDPMDTACHALAEAHAFAQFERRIGPAKETRLSRPLVDLLMAGW
jgi:hypothetical protein